MGASNKNTAKTAAVMNLLTKKPERSGAGAVPNSGTIGGREQIEYIGLGLIDGDPKNFYALNGLDELAANIELLGLQQPIRVRPGEQPGRYTIVSGHRRHAAVAKLVEEGRTDLGEIACIVEREAGSATLQELRMIYANSDTRKMSPVEIDRQAQRVEALLYQLKEEEGYEFPGRMRDHVAQACKVSKSKLSRLKVIREGLEERWRTGYEKGRLAEAAAYTLAQMPKERQRVIFDGLKKQGEYPSSVYENVISQYGESLAQMEKIQCETYGNGPCVNRESMQRRIMGANCWSYNSCRQCCEKCAELAKCKYACPMLAEKVKQLKADAKARRQQEKLAEEEKARPKVDQIKALWKRFGEARAAAGKSPEECYKAGGMYFLEGDRDAYGTRERLECKMSESTKLPYGYSCYLGEVQRYVHLADLLGVSLDYLLCRTDVPSGCLPQPEGQLVLCGWMPGGTLPFQPCDVVADFDLGEGAVSRMPCWFDGKQFRYREYGEVVDVQPVRWMVLPPVEEEKGAG